MTTRHVEDDFLVTRRGVGTDAADADEISVVLSDDQPLVIALVDGDPRPAAGEGVALLLVQDLDIRAIESSPHGSSALMTTGNTASEIRRPSSSAVMT